VVINQLELKVARVHAKAADHGKYPTAHLRATRPAVAAELGKLSPALCYHLYGIIANASGCQVRCHVIAVAVATQTYAPPVSMAVEVVHVSDAVNIAGVMNRWDAHRVGLLDDLQVHHGVQLAVASPQAQVLVLRIAFASSTVVAAAQHLLACSSVITEHGCTCSGRAPHRHAGIPHLEGECVRNLLRLEVVWRAATRVWRSACTSRTAYPVRSNSDQQGARLCKSILHSGWIVKHIKFAFYTGTRVRRWKTVLRLRLRGIAKAYLYPETEHMRTLYECESNHAALQTLLHD